MKTHPATASPLNRPADRGWRTTARLSHGTLHLFRRRRAREVTEAARVTATQERVWFAQAIRGVAALLVVWQHFGDNLLRHWDGVAEYTMLPPDNIIPPVFYVPALAFLDAVGLNAGALGVALFFLTSGFVIPFSLQQRTLGGFFLRRFFRLYPVHWLGLALVLGIVTWHAAALGIPFRYSLMNIFVNGILVNPYLGHAEINSVTWTLVVEELFYAGAALLACRGVLDRRWILLTCATVAVIACMLNPLALPMGQRVHIALQALLHNGLLVVYIMIGVGFYWWYRGRWSARAALTTAGLLWAGFVLAIFVLSRMGGPAPTGQISTATLIPIVSFTVALILFVTLMLGRNHLPHSNVVDWLAKISYPMYVFHTFLGFHLLYVFASWTGSYWAALGGTMLILFALTSAVHIFVENPCNEFGRRLSARLGWEHTRWRGPGPGLVLTPN